MKKLLLSLVAAALFAMPLVSQAQTGCDDYTAVPYSTGFEGIATGGLPDCWTQISTAGGFDGVVFPCAYAYAGNARNSSVYFEFEAHAPNGQTAEIVALPRMENIAGLKLTFWASAQQSYLPVLEVGVIEGEGEEAEFVSVQTITLITSYSWGSGYNQYTVHFAGYEGEGERIALRAVGTSTGQYTLMLDDFSVEEDNGCDPITSATVSAIGPHTATISWGNAGLMADGYTVYYGTANSYEDENILTEEVDGTTVTLTGLQSATQYHAWVRTNCGDDQSGYYQVSAFTTLISCPAVTNVQATNITAEGAIITWTPQGEEESWLVIVDGDVENAVTVTEASYEVSGFEPMTGHTVGIRALCEDDDMSSVTTINFATACDGPTCNFTVNGTDEYGDGWNGSSLRFMQAGIEVGSVTMTSGNSITANVEVCSAAPVSIVFTKGSWAQEMGGTITDGSGAVVFTIENMNGHATGDVLATVEIPCPNCIVPGNLTVSELTAHEAVLTWQAGSDEAEWQVVVDGNVDAAETVSETTYTLSGLNGQSTHTVAVSAICAGDEMSNPATVTFTTPVSCPVVSNVQVSDITSESATLSWTAGGEETEWVVVVNGDNENAYTVNDEPTLALDGLEPMTGYTVAVRGVCGEGDTAAAVEHTFATECAASTCNITLVMNDSYYGLGWMGSSLDVYQAGLLVGSYSMDDEGTQTETVEVCGSAPVVFNCTEGYYSSYASFEIKDGSGATFYSATSLSGLGEAFATMENPCPNCIMPNGFVATEITATSATITWVAQEGQDAWVVRLGNDEEAEEISVTEPTYTFDGLEARTQYTVYVATDCGGDDISNYAPFTFLTDCSTGSCDITVEMHDQYNDGWNGGSVDFYQNGALAGSATISSGNSGTGVVNVCSGLPLEIRLTPGSYPSEISFTIYDGAEEVICSAAQGSLNSSTNVLATVENACPSCLKPANLVASAIDSNSLSFTWTVNEEVSGYVVSFNGGEWEDNGAGEYIAEDLDPNTAYTIAVKAVCTEEDTSNARTLTVKTSCGQMALPYTEGFELDANDAMPSCWTLVTPNATYDGYPGVSASGNTGSHGLTMAAGYGDSTIVATSLVPLDGDQIYVSFWASVNNGNTLRAGVMTDLTDPSTFIPVLSVPYNQSVYTQYEFNTSELDAEADYYVAFRLVCGTNNHYADLDDILIRQDDGCMYPADLAADPSDVSVNLTWTNAGSVESFAVEYRTVGGAWSTAMVTTETEYDVTGLNAATPYEFRVGSICGNDTMWVNISMTTSCAILPVPYSENFDAYAENVLPPCWDFNQPSAITHYDGGLFYRSGFTGVYAVLPLLDGAITKYEVSFDAKLGPINDNYDQVMIGLANNAGELVGWLDTLNDPNQSRSSFVHFTYRFNGQSLSGGTRVALGRLTAYGSDWSLIDNIQVVELPGCISPEQVAVHNSLNPDSTYFTWNAPVDVIAQGWQVYVAPEDETEIDETAIVDVPAESHSYLIPAGVITGGVKYNFYVRTVCNEFEQSEWAVCNFASGQVILPQNGTDTIQGCGFVVYDNGGPIAGYQSSTNSAVVLRPTDEDHKLQVTGGFIRLFYDGASSFRIYDGEGTNGTVLYERNTTNSELYNESGYEPIDSLITSTNGSLTISLNAGVSVDKGFEIFVTCIENDEVECVRPLIQNVVPTYNTITVNYTAPASVEATIATDGTTLATVTSEASPVTFEGLTENTDYTISLRTICDEGVYSEWQSATGHTTTAPVVQPDTCEVPTNVTVTEITQTTAVVSWTSTGSAWNIDVNGTIIENVVTNPYTLTGLNPGTNYSVRVQNICPDIQNSDWSNGFGFSTLVGIDGVGGSHIALYPNPATTTVTLSGIDGVAQVVIVDMNGRTNGEWRVENGELTIDLNGYAKGAYFVRIIGENVNSIRKLIVK